MSRKVGLMLALGLTACPGDFYISDSKASDPDTDLDTDVPAPDIAVSPSTVMFGTLAPFCTSEDQLVTISNVGTAPLVIDKVTVEGADRAAFSATDPLFNLGPNESTDVFVDFVARDKVPYTAARLVIESNDPDEPVVRIGLDGAGGDERIVEEVFSQDQSDGVDVLFMLDKSSSMEEDIKDLQVHFATFINVFLQLGLDYHLGVMSIDDDCPTLVGPVIDKNTPDPAAEFTKQVGSPLCNDNEHTFDAITKAFNATNLAGANAGFLRPKANLAVVVFTDEPEQSGEFFNRPTPQSVINFLASLKGGDKTRITFSGLVGPETAAEAASCLLRANPALPDDRYHRAIRQGNGYLGRICNVKVQPFLQLLSKKASGLQFEFPLGHIPKSTDPSEWEVLVGSTPAGPGQVDGWVYNTIDNTIVLDGAAVPQPGDTLTVKYPTDAACEE